MGNQSIAIASATLTAVTRAVALRRTPSHLVALSSHLSTLRSTRASSKCAISSGNTRGRYRQTPYVQACGQRFPSRMPRAFCKRCRDLDWCTQSGFPLAMFEPDPRPKPLPASLRLTVQRSLNLTRKRRRPGPAKQSGNRPLRQTAHGRRDARGNFRFRCLPSHGALSARFGGVIFIELWRRPSATIPPHVRRSFLVRFHLCILQREPPRNSRRCESMSPGGLA